MQPLKSVEEAATLLGISPWTVRAYIRDGKLQAVRLGRRVLLTEEALESLVAEGLVPRQDHAEPGEAAAEGAK